MLTRLFRSTIVLVALVVAYQVYVLTVVPMVEPVAVVRGDKTIDQQTRDNSYDAFSRYHDLLSHYFPEGHWTLSKPAPKLLRFDSFMVVVKDYRRHDDGSVDLDECAVLIMPHDWEFGSGAPLEAVVLEAPGGAHLQFDDDFQPTQGRMGRIVYGRFPGQITIRSDMKLPGSEDNLLITTSNLEMNDSLIHTDEEVMTQLGPNVGRGRKLDIRLKRDQHIQRGPSIVGFQSLEVLEDVVLQLDPDGFDVFGSEPAAGDKVAAKPARPSNIVLTSAQAPVSAFRPTVEVKCAGRFHVDLINFVASFDRNVTVTRMRLDGPFDQIDCDELSIQFSPVDENGDPVVLDDPNIARRQREAVGRFKAVALTATGHPVRADSPMQQASAEANRVYIDLLDRRISLDEGREVWLKQGGNEIHALSLDYQMPPEDSASSLGELLVAGPGWMRAIPDVERPDRVVDIAWKSAATTQYPLQLTRRNGQPLLMLAGQPVIDAHRLGKISAQRMELSLREVPADGEQGPAIELTKDPAKLAIMPERLLAAGEVVFASPQLTGTTHQLQGDFTAGQLTQASNGGGSTSTVSDRLNRVDDPNKRTAIYDLAANQIQLELAINGNSAEPTAVECEGAVVLRETQTAKPGEEPVEVRGNRLEVNQLNQDAKITVVGRHDPQLGTPGTATISARGLTLAAEKINADQKAGRFWINGPGIATMNVSGEAFGQPKGTTTPVTLTWQKGLDAADRRIVVSGRILAESQYGWVQAERGVALLTRSLKLEKESADGKIDIAQVALEGGVVGDHRGLDDTGPTSHENFRMKTLTYDRLTGNVQGTGPGVLRSVRLSDGSMNFADLASAANPQAPAAPKPSKQELRFLRVDFADGLTGNVEQRVVRFHGRVKSVYGPVASWQEELPLHAPDRLPFDTVTLNCETLEVNEAPVGRRMMGAKAGLGPLEIRAIDNVEIEGRSEKEGVFQAQAVTASYSQQKDVFILKGDNQQDAVIYHRNAENGQYERIPAGTILYYRSEPRVELKDARGTIEYQQTTPRASIPRTNPAVGPIR